MRAENFYEVSLPWPPCFRNVQEVLSPPGCMALLVTETRDRTGTLPVSFVSVEWWNVDRPGFDAHWRDDCGFDYHAFLRYAVSQG